MAGDSVSASSKRRLANGADFEEFAYILSRRTNLTFGAPLLPLPLSPSQRQG